MSDFIADVQIFLFWFLVLFAFADLVLILAKHFIKDEAVEKKRTFLFYCSFGITMAFVFLISLLPYVDIHFEDQTVWNVSVVLGGTGAVIMGFFVFYSYPSLWLQRKKGKNK